MVGVAGMLCWFNGTADFIHPFVPRERGHDVVGVRPVGAKVVFCPTECLMSSVNMFFESALSSFLPVIRSHHVVVDNATAVEDYALVDS